MKMECVSSLTSWSIINSFVAFLIYSFLNSCLSNGSLWHFIKLMEVANMVEFPFISIIEPIKTGYAEQRFVLKLALLFNKRPESFFEPLFVLLQRLLSVNNIVEVVESQQIPFLVCQKFKHICKSDFLWCLFVLLEPLLLLLGCLCYQFSNPRLVVAPMDKVNALAQVYRLR